jgi:tRNA threonylcarbamoyladenosine biosynthesis protein TsaE
MDNHRSIITKNAEETSSLGQTLGSSIAATLKRGGVIGANIFCLFGDLGSGKTTFTQGLAKGLGITARLLSPTFIIVRRYEIPEAEGFLYHLDLYRTQSAADVKSIGLDEILSDNQSCVVIEWAEKLGSALPLKRTDIRFLSAIDGHKVDITTYI